MIQYDELDALFTQFVLNSSVGASPSWLSTFNSTLLDWTGFTLEKNINNRCSVHSENEKDLVISEGGVRMLPTGPTPVLLQVFLFEINLVLSSFQR